VFAKGPQKKPLFHCARNGGACNIAARKPAVRLTECIIQYSRAVVNRKSSGMFTALLWYNT